MKDYSELKKLAECATPGPWVAQHPNAGQRGSEVASGDGLNQVCADLGPSNALYIASANPAAFSELIAEVEGLRSGWYSDECDNLRFLPEELSESKQEVDRLEAEVEALRKDAERYRWLRKQNWFDSDIAVVRSPNESIKIGYDCPSTERLDDYIDNEMKESKS